MKIYLTLIIVCFSLVANAQAVKIGYADVDYILNQLPEAKQIESNLKSYEQQLAKQLDEKAKEFEQKYTAFSQGQATMAQSVRDLKQQELQDLQKRIQDFQVNAESDMQKKQVEMLQPVYNKIQDAIDQVASEGDYTFIFNVGVSGISVLLFAKDETNVSDSILKKLGVTPTAQ